MLERIPPNLDQFVEHFPYFAALALPSRMLFFCEISKVKRKIENDAYFVARAHGNHQKTFEVFRRPLSAVPLGNVDGHRTRRASQLRTELSALLHRKLFRSLVNLQRQLITALVRFQITITGDARWLVVAHRVSF